MAGHRRKEEAWLYPKITKHDCQHFSLLITSLNLLFNAKSKYNSWWSYSDGLAYLGALMANDFLLFRLIVLTWVFSNYGNMICHDELQRCWLIALVTRAQIQLTWFPLLGHTLQACFPKCQIVPLNLWVICQYIVFFSFAELLFSLWIDQVLQDVKGTVTSTSWTHIHT